MKNHLEIMEALKMYHFAGMSVRIIRWLAVVGAALVAIAGFMRSSK